MGAAVAAERARILVVDDDKQVRSFLEELLVEAGYAVELVSDGRTALGIVEREPPDLVLLDVVMPGMGGLEVLRIIKAPNDLRFLPVILLTGDTDIETRLKGLKLGADDYLTKPANSEEVLARIEALLRIKRLQDRITDSRRELQDAALIDSQTGLYNARYLELRLRDEFKRAERYNEPISCLVMVLEGWADAQAALGAERAGAVLKTVADLVRSGVREFDVVMRTDADRFVILLPRTHFAGSMAVAARLWNAVRTNRFQFPGRAKDLLVSIGVAFFPDRDVTSAEQLLAKVERALEKARAQGPGQICLFQQTAYFFTPDQAE